MSKEYILGMTGEKVLIDGCVKNDRACQQELYSRYCRKMLMVCQRYTRTMVDAEDILQEGFIKVFGHIGSFKGAAKLETWMTRIFINSASIISGKNCTCFLWMQKQQWSPPTTEHGGRMFNSMIGYRISTGNIRLYAAAGYKFQSVRSRYDFSNDQSGRYFYGLT